MIKLIAGLGNPGTDYMMTRHNAGIQFVEALALVFPSDYGWRAEKEAVIYKTENLILARTKDKFMNQSGEWVKWLLNYSANSNDPKELCVVHDDLDIKLGEYKVQFGTGPKDHGGINSVEALLGTKEFWRVRIGVDNRSEQLREPGEEYVLKRFLNSELDTLKEVINKAIAEITKQL
jgi:PTH1 family peptidyl-tRNA hydrolase